MVLRSGIRCHLNYSTFSVFFINKIKIVRKEVHLDILIVGKLECGKAEHTHFALEKEVIFVKYQIRVKDFPRS